MALDLTKPVQTRSGLAARIVFTALNNAKPVLAVVTQANGNQIADQWTVEGFKDSPANPGPLDLVNVDGVTRGFVNVTDAAGTISLALFPTRAQANAAAGPDRVARVAFSYANGQAD